MVSGFNPDHVVDPERFDLSLAFLGGKEVEGGFLGFGSMGCECLVDSGGSLSMGGGLGVSGGD